MESVFSTTSAVSYIFKQQCIGDPCMGMRMINERLLHAKNLYRKDLYAHYGCVNAVEFSNDGRWLVSGGDDKRVLMWNVNKALFGKYHPVAMKGEHNSNIFCLGFDSKHTKLFSAGNDEQVVLHDVATGETSDVFLHDEAVYGLSVDPQNENIFASACDDGRVLIWDIRASSNDALDLARYYSSAFHAVMYNPVEPRFLTTANAKEGVGLWDIRKPRVCLRKYGGGLLSQSAMSVRFNSMGTHILALRRRLPPVLYEIGSVHAAAEFDHREYYNSCTMKSCCFAGDRDQYILSGSDDFKLYMWKVPDNISKKGIWINDAHLVLRGHRSIVNQVRYNSTYGILASSGVEKIIKLWSTFPMAGSGGNIDYVSNKDGLRKVYSHEEYINLVLESGQFMTHDYSHHSVQEDPRMMAFFDSLVQRDIEGWTSDSSETSAAGDALSTCFEVQSDVSTSSSDLFCTSSSDEEDCDDSERELFHTRDTLRSRVRNYLDLFKYKQDTDVDYKSCHNREENSNLTSDKISQLIVKKRRREQKVKMARTRMRLKKRLLKKDSKTQEEESLSNRSDGLDEAKIVLNKAVENRINDKRKLLQKKRAKLLQIGTLSDNSSDDSDIANELGHSSVNNNSAEINLNFENGVVVPKSEDVEHEENNVIAANGLNNGVFRSLEPINSENMDDLHVPETSFNGLNGSRTSSDISNETRSTLFFPRKSSRHNMRNYRKRSAEDMQDDC